MADAERLFLASMLREDNGFALLRELGVHEHHFADEEHLLVLRWVRDHHTRYGKTPSEQAVKSNFSSWSWPKTPEPIQYYADKIRERYTYDVMQDVTSQAADLLEADPGNALEVSRMFATAANEVSVEMSALSDHNLTDPKAFDRMYDFYESLTENPGSLRGLATGFPTIDMATMGLQPGQLITLVGPPKSLKTAISLSVADHISCEEHADTLFITFEMGYEELMTRWVGLRAGLNYRRLLKGKMNAMDRKRLDRLYDKLQKETYGKLILSEDVSSTTTVGGIVAKIQEHKPKAVFVDGVYLMDDELGEDKGSSQALTNITRSLKRTAKMFNIPIFISTQALRSKMRGNSVKAGSAGYTSSFEQDSDTLLASEVRESPDGGPEEHWLKVTASRSGPLAEVQIEADWATSSFSEYASAYADEDPDEEDDGQIKGRRSA